MFSDSNPGGGEKIIDHIDKITSRQDLIDFLKFFQTRAGSVVHDDYKTPVYQIINLLDTLGDDTVDITE